MPTSNLSEQESALLARIDERTVSILHRLDSIEKIYVTRNEFNPVKSIVYGMVGVILLAVLGALTALVIK